MHDDGMLPLFVNTDQELDSIYTNLNSALSESGSITPDARSSEFFIHNNELLRTQIELIVKLNNEYIENKLQELNVQQNQNLETLRSYDINPLSESLNRELVDNQIQLKDILEQQIRILQDFADNRKALYDQLLELDLARGELNTNKEYFLHCLEEEYNHAISLKTYIEYQNSGIEEKKGENALSSKVLRFSLIAEELTGIIDKNVGYDLLHPVEYIIFDNAIKYLQAQGETKCGVACDFLVRNEHGSVLRDEKSNQPETHCIVLWKDTNDGKLYLVDPNQHRYSDHMVKRIINANLCNEIEPVTIDILYTLEDKKIGRDINDARDCIDISIKIILELTKQSQANPDYDFETRKQNAFRQIATFESTFSDYFKYNKKFKELKTPRDLTSTLSAKRELTLENMKQLFISTLTSGKK